MLQLHTTPRLLIT